ncbi:prepilin-type N-terminal cleavage/methylation domain-containing protein [Shewanella xiamenensis]|nr:type II secretion system protein [Shewanella xiamenensis]
MKTKQNGFSLIELVIVIVPVCYQYFSSRKIETLFTEKHFGAVN